MAKKKAPENPLGFEAPIEELEKKIQELEAFAASTEMDLTAQIAQLKVRCTELKRDIYGGLSPWQRVQIARHPNRPATTDYAAALFDDCLELHGDRAYADDRAILTALARLDSRRVLLVGHRKGKTTKERLSCNFGSAHPEGYRKALLKMQFAAKYGLPVITLINTPGAYPGIGAEERGQAQVIARNLMEMARLPVPVVSVVIGEGGSGGALGIGVGDRILMLENAYYSVISPEGCSAILWKTGEMTEEAARILKLTARDLRGLGVIDEVVPEPLGGAHRDPAEAVRLLKAALLRNLDDLGRMGRDELLASRYEKFRRIGRFVEEPIPEAPAASPEPEGAHPQPAIARS
ncbi:MAG: acetyl-CoA carboxylase carboxyltransferase subunit alpha [Planctomycetes bacterium]|nr:acetyl-CoA carboxylase carboxyltransferase subunit alpha [Planctomycetota bacterium]